jgi:hypothetical protein
MAIDPGRVKALFQSAIEQPDLADREAFLDREIVDDAELRPRLDALMAAFDRPPGVLDRPLDSDHQVTIDEIYVTQRLDLLEVASMNCFGWSTSARIVLRKNFPGASKLFLE